MVRMLSDDVYKKTKRYFRLVWKNNMLSTKVRVM